MDISIVIPFIHEYPALIHTVFGFENELRDSGLSYEIIVVENREVDPYTEKFLHYMRATISTEKLRYFFEPTPCGPIARNTGARNSRGNVLLFTDAHVLPGKDTVRPMYDFLLDNPSIGMVHGTTVWSHYDAHHAGAHYKLFNGGGPQLNSHFHGTYQRLRDATEPYRIAGGTQAYIVYRRQEFLQIGGYHPECRFYPHPENYACMKYQMQGMSCYLHPKCHHYHSLYPRNYGPPPTEQPWHDYTIENAMICAYTLGGFTWAERIYKYWLSKGGKKDVLDKLSRQAAIKSNTERQWILNNCMYTLDQVLWKLYTEKVPGMEDYPYDNPNAQS